MTEHQSLRPLKVATLNLGGGFRWKEAALVHWQRRERIDAVCLTETGRLADESLRSSGTFVAPCTKDQGRNRCAILIAPWIGGACLEYAAPNGALILVSVPMGGGCLTIGAAYAPQSLQQHPRLAEIFWQGLRERLSAVKPPFVLSIDVNYPTLPSNKLNVDVWHDVE